MATDVAGRFYVHAATFENSGGFSFKAKAVLEDAITFLLLRAILTTIRAGSSLISQSCFAEPPLKARPQLLFPYPYWNAQHLNN